MTAMTQQAPAVALVVDVPVLPPAEHGLRALGQALERRELAWRRDDATNGATPALTIVAGIGGESPLVDRLLAQADVVLPASAEALAFVPLPETPDGPTLVIAGSDARGLMYALLEASQRLETAAAVERVLDLFPVETEAPDLALRSICLFPHNAALERDWFYDRAYWEDYFATLARARFNTFTLIFGHQTAYLSPPYPFFVDLPEFPEVVVPTLSASERARNLATLRMIGQLSVAHGVDFALGVWQQHAHEYGRPQVDGLTSANLQAYCAAGMKKMLEECPEISGVQLRVNAESGILLEEEPEFWRAIFNAARDCGRPIRLNIRAKAILDDTIEAAMETGLPVEVCTKHWMEHLGLPYLATDLQIADRMVRRHGYNDLVPNGHPYDFVFQLWNLGSNKLFLWGDFDWVRDFAKSCQLGGARGFEVCMPLSNKGFRDIGGNWPIFADPEYVWYRWESERYWPWYLLFGRLGYRAGTDETVWQRELAAHFGPTAAPAVDQALRHGSRFLPLITAAHAPSASVFGYWPEKDTGGLLDFYLEVEPSDLARFYGVLEYTEAYLAGRLGAKLSPGQIADRLDALADTVMAALDEAEGQVSAEGAAEFRGVQLDMRAQALLARYHAAKLRAATGLAFFYTAGDSDALRQARREAEAAAAAWQALVDLTSGVYPNTMVFGPMKDQSGHWRDQLVYVQHDVARLDEVADLFERLGLFDHGFDFGAPPTPRTSYWVLPIVNDYSVERRFTGVFTDTLYTPARGHGWHSARGLTAGAAPTISPEVLRGAAPRAALLPRDMLLADHVGRARKAHYDNNTFLVDVPNGRYEVRFLMADRSPNAPAHGPMWITIQGRHRIEPFVVAPGEVIERTIRVPVRHGRLEIEFNADPNSDFIISALTVTRVAPHLGHVPPLALPADQPWRVAATVTGPEPISAVRLRTLWDGEATWRETPLPEETPHCHVASLAVPAGATGVTYTIVATDTAGTETLWPNAEGWHVPVATDTRPPVISHEAVQGARAGQAVEIRATVTGVAPLRDVTLFYRGLNQKEPLVPLVMTAEGQDYLGVIPAEDVVAEWDLLYFIEAVDTQGGATVFPSLDTPPPYIVVPVSPAD